MVQDKKIDINYSDIVINDSEAESLTILSSGVNLQILKDNLEQTPILPILEGTELQKKQLEIYKTWGLSEQEAKEKFVSFSQNVDKSVKTYLKSMFGNEFNNPKAIDNMSIAIQFAMMEVLSQSENTADVTKFFGNFANIDFQTVGNAFTGLLSSFATGGLFFGLAKKVDNMITFLSSNQNDLTNSNLFKDPILFKKYLIDTQSWNSNILSYAEKEEVRTEEQYILELQTIANDKKLSRKLNSDLLKKLAGEGENKGAIENSIFFLEQRGKYKDSAIAIVDVLSDALSFEIPFIGKISSLLEIDSVEEIFGSKDNNGVVSQNPVLNFVLKLFGYDGVSGLMKKYTKDKLDKLVIGNNKTYISDGYNHYIEEGEHQPVDENLLWSTIKQKDKLPIDLDTLADGILVGLDTIDINSRFLSSINIPVGNYIDLNNKIINGREKDFVENYIENIIKYLLSNTKFINYLDSKSKNKQEDFLFAVFGLLVGGDLFLDGMIYGDDVLNKDDYNLKTTVNDSNNPDKSNNSDNSNITYNIDDLVYDQPNLLSIKDLEKTGNYLEQKIYVDYLHSLEKEYGLPSFMLYAICQKESSGYNYRDNLIIKGASGEIGMFQFMPDTIKEVYLKNKNKFPEYEESEESDDNISKKIASDPILSARASAIFIASQGIIGDEFDPITAMVRYNRGIGNYNRTIGEDILIDENNFLQVRGITQQYIKDVCKTILEKNSVRNTKNLNLADTFVIIRDINSPEVVVMDESKIIANAPLKFGGMGTSIMQGFSGNVFNNMTGVQSSNSTALTQDAINKIKEQKSNGQLNIDSFLMYYGGNGIDISDLDKTLNRLKEASLSLSSGENSIQPVFSTLILRNPDAIKDKTAKTAKRNLLQNRLKQQNAKIKKFNKKLRELVETEGYKFPLIDFENMSGEYKILPDDYEIDGVHLKQSGYTKMQKYIQSKMSIQQVV